MNTLIIGGLFALAVLALIAVAFLVRGETKTAKIHTVKVESEPAREAQAKETAEIAAAGAPAQPGLPAPREESLPEQRTVQHFPVANGQFHKLSVELHSLHGQAQEIEHRLSILTEMIERIEDDQNQYVNIEEEASHSTGYVSVN